MIEQDTIKLLRECDAGIRMGVDSIGDVLDHVHDRDLKNYLVTALREHKELDVELQEQLDRYGDEGKAPNPVAKSMSWMKTAVKLQWNESDATIAELMTDGCHMGVKSLSRYLNQYAAADETSKHICKNLIILEDRLGSQMRAYL